MASNSPYLLTIMGGDIITNISYATNSFVTFPVLTRPLTPTIRQLDHGLINISLEATLTPSPQAALNFVKACGNPTHTYSTSLETVILPPVMDFYFEAVVNFKTPAGDGTANLYLGSYDGNWWIGGNGINGDVGKPVIQLKVGDSGTPFTLRLSATPPGLFTVEIGTYPIKHVFVLMLENHSFDCLFAMSGIPGIDVATTNKSNSFNGTKYNVTKGAPTTMPADPGHEFTDTLEQLAGPGANYPKNGPYPPINNSGFASDFATKTTASNIGDIMAAFDTPNQLPVIYQLATEYTLCDHWFSSLPGPTWPNRFFVHGASSAGLDHSPNVAEESWWEFANGFSYPNGSIYDAMNKNNVSWRIYNDSYTYEYLTNTPVAPVYLPYPWCSYFSDDPMNGDIIGAIPQVCALKGISVTEAHSLTNFADDLKGYYPYQYTFIEPHYGNLLLSTYAGGSSQHPMDDVYGGEKLIKYVYESIRNSPLWDTSLLIITYDEHGGFYDSVAPIACPAPNDKSSDKYNKYGFNFGQYGVRVPAIIISPWVAAKVDTTVYDHSSALATVEKLFGLPSLTERDEKANNLTHLFLSVARPDSDCPATLNSPAPPAAKTALTSEEIAAIESQPIPTDGNLPGFLAIMLKTELELSSGEEADRTAILEKYKTILTIGDAKAQNSIFMEKVAQAKAAKI